MCQLYMTATVTWNEHGLATITALSIIAEMVLQRVDVAKMFNVG